MWAGTDIAFLGGMIKYIIDNNLMFREYVVNYTNAPFLVNPDFKGPSDLNGLFSGYDEKTRKYDKKTGEELPRTGDAEKAEAAAVFYERYVAARQHPEYVRQKKLHQEKFEGK